MPPQHPPPQEYARVFLIIIFLFYLYTSPDQQAGPPGFPRARDFAAERVARQRHGLEVLNETRWGGFQPHRDGYDPPRYLNLTGFREKDNYDWARLEGWRARSEVFSKSFVGAEGKDSLSGRVYENATGIVQGKWVRYEGDLATPPVTGGRNLNLSEIAPGIDWAYRNEEDWTRNITGREGKLMLRVDEKTGEAMDVGDNAAGKIREVAATMTIQDETSSGDGWEMRIHGVHWPAKGVMLMTTTSEKFAGIFALPHLSPTMDQFTSSQKILNKTLEQTIDRSEKSIYFEATNPWSSNPNSQSDAMFPVPHCEYLVYVQVHPTSPQFLHKLDDFPQDLKSGLNAMRQFEEELRFPTGAPIDEIPKLQMSTVIFSPDCGFMLESKGPPTFAPVDGEHLMGVKQEVWLLGIRNWLLIFSVVIFGQILIMKIQMKEASTPSTIARISLFTAGIMVMADSLIFSSFSLLSATAPNIFPSALLTSFAALLSVALGVRFTLALYKAQEPERRERERVRAAAEAAVIASRPRPAPTVVITPAGADTLPAPVTSTAARHNEPPIIIPSDQDVDAEIAEVANAASAVPRPTQTPGQTLQPLPPRGVSEFAAIYGQFVLILSFLLFLTLSSVSWSVPYRTAYTHLLSFIYLSIWLPQIYRNVVRNCRKALLWKFVIGQSVLRLLPFAYFYLSKDNILFARSDWTAFTVLAGWIWIQIWILFAQEILGPRWGLPKHWYEEGWDYHPILREDNVEAGGLPIGLVQIPDSPSATHSGSETKQNARSVDCAICMQVLEVPVVAAGEESEVTGGVAGMLARRAYMITPCRHVFHSHCLEGWMRFRLQCPICRENLPPL
ncbi:hypothetical protein PVAG01_10733 [Phlyctema vagabunda]|uniref:RING-type E3 ubiquitin transferase n=1 Tax=Phlyctema vagabunda TaxID=108571 RepID=A0ABR4P333_9HELO